MPDSLAKLAEGLEPLDHMDNIDPRNVEFHNAALAAVREMDSGREWPTAEWMQHKADVETVARFARDEAQACQGWNEDIPRDVDEAARRLLGEG